MNVTDMTNAASTLTNAQSPQNDALSLGKEDFLKLFLESLKNQDPMSPMDNSAMMQQLSQLGQMEAIANLKLTVDEMKESLLGNKLQQGASLLGKQVSAIDSSGAVVSGKADKMTVNGDLIELLINNKTVQLGQITNVSI